MSRVRVILQARMSSSRLPGKSLLPVRGVPLVVLAGLRASRKGHEVVVATSDQPMDDVIEETARYFGLAVVRGPLDDVMGRFIVAAEGLEDDAAVVRLTADNVFPDGDLVALVLEEFWRHGHTYLTTSSTLSDVPHGLSVEVFKAGILREAAKSTSDKFDREHVTPWIQRTCGVNLYRPPSLPTGAGRLRCTVDSLDDYERILRVFRKVSDPVKVSWLTLVHELAALPDVPRFRIPVQKVNEVAHSSFVLGTAQLGMPYGIANRAGQPSVELSMRIIRTAVEYGVTHLDTARAYGDSERRIGLALSGGWSRRARVVTKLLPMDRLGVAPSRVEVINAVDASVLRSCRELKMSSLHTVLLHRAADRERWGGLVWKRLLELREEGIIGSLGVSVQSPNEALNALKDPDVQHLQLPFNLLDWRWRRDGVDVALRQRQDVTVHVRSVLLQGLLATLDSSIWPPVQGVDPSTLLAQLVKLSKELERESVIDLALAYVLGHSWIHGVVIGLETMDQLMTNLRLFTKPALTSEEIEVVNRTIKAVPESLLNPALWARREEHEDVRAT